MLIETEGAYIACRIIDPTIPRLADKYFQSPLWREMAQADITDFAAAIDQFPDHMAEIMRAIDHATPANAPTYAKRIKADYQLRQAKGAAHDIATAQTPNEARQYAEAILDETKPVDEAKPIFDDLLDELDADSEIYSTGFPLLDKLTGGFRAGQLVVVGGATSMGKTAYLLSMLAAMRRPAVFATAEMSAVEIAERLMAIVAGVNLHTMRTRNFTEADWTAMTDAAASWAVRDLKVQAICRPDEISAERGEVIFVDYLQFLTAGETNPYADVRSVSKSLKTLATRNNSPVIVACQLNRAVDHRKDREPRLSDLRDSGTIAQDADIVIFPFRPSEYGQSDDTELIVAKNRHGPKGRCPLQFKPETARYWEPHLTMAPALTGF